MAIYHFNADVISRSQGRSAVACAAYRAGDKLYDERYEKTHDYTRKEDVAYSEILAPENAPAWMKNREQLWNGVEAFEKRKDSQLARDLELTLPRELTLEQNIALVKEFIHEEYVNKGMVADLGIHIDKATDGEMQPHAHVMLTMREIKDEGFGQKVREWNDKENLLQWRESWANVVNRHLAFHEHDLRIDHRSYAEQGIALEPQNKIGASVVQTQKARFEDHQRIARENGEKIFDNPQILLDAITRQQSTFTQQDIARYVNRNTEDAEQFQQVYAKVKASPELVALGKDEKGSERFTTQEMLTLESAMMERAERFPGRLGHGVSAEAQAVGLASKQLSAEQKAAYEHLLGAEDLKCVIGYAGTGKSYLLDATREAWEVQGYKVQGITLSGIAAQNLEASSGIESHTLANRLYYWDKGQALLTNRDVVVIDEAGMLGSRQVARVLEEADKRGAKVVLVGDPEQLQAIEAGAAFRAISERVGYVELTEIRRQREEWQKSATIEFATGKTAEALSRYASHDNLHAYDTDLEAKQAIINHWNDARISDPEKTQIMLAYTRKEVRELNVLARDLRAAHGELGKSQRLETFRGPRDFAENDRIYFMKNDRGLDVKNGTLGTLERIEGQRLTVRLDKDERYPDREPRHVEVDLEHYQHVEHGYAATFHKGQGINVDRSYVLASNYMDRHAAYVGMTRHRESADIFYSREAFKDEKAFAQALSRDRSKDLSLDYSKNPKEYAAHYGLEKGLDAPKTLSKSREYQQAYESYSRNIQHKESALERVEARREAKALQAELGRLERDYDKPISHELEKGEKGIYREAFEVGKNRYAVLETEDELKVVPYEKGMEKYKAKEVKIHEVYDTQQERKRVELEPSPPSRERGGKGREIADDFDLSL